MAFKGLTINTAAEEAGHIYAEDDAAIYQSILGSDGVLNIGNCLKATVISNNKVRISDGVLCVGGHIGRTRYADYQDMTIENGATGYNRNDIIYARFLTSGSVDTYTLVVKKGTATTGTATDPATTAGNLYQGATERDYPLYRVKLSGLSISAVEKLFTVIPTIPELKSQLEQKISALNEGLSTVNNQLNGFTFYTTYIEAGKSGVNIAWTNIETNGVFPLLITVGMELFYVVIFPSQVSSTIGTQGVSVFNLSNSKTNYEFEAALDLPGVRLKMKMNGSESGTPVTYMKLRPIGSLKYIVTF